MNKKFLFYFLVTVNILIFSCSTKKKDVSEETTPPPIPKEIVYDETGCLFTTYKGLVMAGYQGWFTANEDGAERGWHHYEKNGKFEQGYASVDFWPGVNEYSITYKTGFKYADGTDAYVYSPYDESSVDLHFKWMKDYGLDGVFMQRFVGEIKGDKGKRHFNKVLENALKAANKYQRAICVMYDLSGSSPADMQILINDWNELQNTFSLFDNVKNPTYLRHNKKPLLVIWGVGFNDGRKYSTSDVQAMVSQLKGPEKKVSIMLGVPYGWRTLNRDTENNPLLHTLIKQCDIIMPWAVGRYNSSSYESNAVTLVPDIEWCRTNNITYVPLVFPGFSWGNLKNDMTIYNQIPRNKGDFFWKQVSGAKMSGAESLYIAMFDEIDEGTAIFKCAKEGNLPLNGAGKFVGIEQDLGTDYYLWLAGKATDWFHGGSNYDIRKPLR